MKRRVRPASAGVSMVLTLDFVDEQGHPTHEALRSVLEYFGQRLGGASPQS